MRENGFFSIIALLIGTITTVVISVYLISKTSLRNGTNLKLIASSPFASSLESTIQKYNTATVTWEEAQQLIRDCQVQAVAQTHQLEVFLNLKDGKRLRVSEPAIDQIFTEVEAVEAKCGPISKATE